MFTIPKFFPFILSTDEEGDNGGGESEEVDDLGVPYTAPEATDSSGNAEVEINPAWNALLENIPEDKRANALPILKEWDGNFSKVQSKYAPYNPLLEHNVSMEEINNAFKFANLVNVNPKALYDELGTRFGFGQGQKQEEKDNKEVSDTDLELPDITKHPQFQQMQQAVEAFQQQAQQEQQRQQEVRIQQDINNEFVQLQQELKVKDFSPKVKAEILRRAAITGDITGDYSIKAGYRDYANFVNEVRNSRANNSAPHVMGGTGALPASGKPLSELSDDERAARIVAFLEASNKEQ